MLPRGCIESLLEPDRAGHPALGKCSGARHRAEVGVVCVAICTWQRDCHLGTLADPSVGSPCFFHYTYCYNDSHVSNAMYMACVCI